MYKIKVKEFISEIQAKYEDDDELYFTMGACDTEFVFDKVTVYDKDFETDVYLEFSEQHRKEFDNAVTDGAMMDAREAIIEAVNRYL